jgi:hypothetical protein
LKSEAKKEEERKEKLDRYLVVPKKNTEKNIFIFLLWKIIFCPSEMFNENWLKRKIFCELIKNVAGLIFSHSHTNGMEQQKKER